MGLACTCRSGPWKGPALVVSTGFVLLVQNIHLPLPTHLLHHRRFLPSAGDNPAHSSKFHAGWAFLWHVSSSKSVSVLCVCPRHLDDFSLCFLAAVYRQLAIWLALIWGRRRRHVYLQENHFPCKTSPLNFHVPVKLNQEHPVLVREENGIAGTQSLPSCPPHNPKLGSITEAELLL